MDRRAVLLELAKAVQPNQAVSVPAAWLVEALAAPDESGDLTVPDLCRQYGRKSSAVRGWLEAGRFPGAYKMNGKEWRVPRAALAAFDAGQRTRGSRRANLGSWRKVRAPAA